MRKPRLLITVMMMILISPWWLRIAGASNAGVGEKVKTYSHQDGVAITVHYNLMELALYHSLPEEYTDAVLQYAAGAYTEIVYNQGFDTPGFTFANPDKYYCYDQDKNIDICITGDAPYFDIIRGEGKDYDAVILFPADYRGYLAKSKPGDISNAKLAERMKGSLFHEMFHVITYSYNKNIQSWYSYHGEKSCYQGGDWYVEGLARYFETIAGSYDKFFSEGFLKVAADKITISQEGVNYLMEHPYQPLKETRYDCALFWAYIHRSYGMEKIEEISRRFRFISRAGINKQISDIMSYVLEKDFREVMREFAVSMYVKDFDISISEGLSDLKAMRLGDFLDKPEKQITPWANNFIAMDLNEEDTPDSILLKKSGDGSELKMAIIANLEGDKIVQLRDITLDRSDVACEMDLSEMKVNGVEKLILIITNTDTDLDAKYRLFCN